MTGPTILPALLAGRGVSDPDEAELRQKLLPYTGLKGIREAAMALAGAIVRQERIVVVADYDCDGATACAIAVSGLAALGADIDFVVPNRMIHGYGLTPAVVGVAQEKNPKWILTVDNGIASVEGVAAANALDIGVVVTDHHLPGDRLPDAAAIVNPNQPGCSFSSKNVAGCGVMFYVLAATRDALRATAPPEIAEEAAKVDVAEWLDLVALGTVADVVKLDANNRWLVDRGLQRIRAGFTRPGIGALFHVSRRDYEWATAQDFGFSLGPRLNAAGRLSDMSIGIRCLLENDPDAAEAMANELNSLNEQRKDIEKGMKETAWAKMEIEGQAGQFTRVVFGKDFHEGVIGIVAGRIKESEFTPTIVFAPTDDGGWKGSGRSVPGCHLRDVLDAIYKRNPTWFAKFGGHAMAAGMTLTAAAREGFAAAFEAEVKKWFNNVLPQQTIFADGWLAAADMTLDTAMLLTRQVWGQGFEEPLWLGRFEVEDATLVGKENNHMRLRVIHEEGGGEPMTAMHFFQEDGTIPRKGDRIEMAFRLAHSQFRGERQMDLIVVERSAAGRSLDIQQA
jgi:single-stranded-DNA-specific exonuclease